MADGYNVLITTESLLSGDPVYRCDDGYLRDTRGIFGSYRSSELTGIALNEILNLLKESEASWVGMLLDKQISKSGELAALIRRRMEYFGIRGTVKTAPDVDRQLKFAKSVVATGDGCIIDAADQVIDLPAELARRMNLEIIVL